MMLVAAIVNFVGFSHLDDLLIRLIKRWITLESLAGIKTEKWRSKLGSWEEGMFFFYFAIISPSLEVISLISCADGIILDFLHYKTDFFISFSFSSHTTRYASSQSTTLISSSLHLIQCILQMNNFTLSLTLLELPTCLHCQFIIISQTNSRKVWLGRTHFIIKQILFRK
jgi:hypothetical protein